MKSFLSKFLSYIFFTFFLIEISLLNFLALLQNFSMRLRWGFNCFLFLLPIMLIRYICIILFWGYQSWTPVHSKVTIHREQILNNEEQQQESILAVIFGDTEWIAFVEVVFAFVEVVFAFVEVVSPEPVFVSVLLLMLVADPLVSFFILLDLYVTMHHNLKISQILKYWSALSEGAVANICQDGHHQILAGEQQLDRWLCGRGVLWPRWVTFLLTKCWFGWRRTKIRFPNKYFGYGRCVKSIWTGEIPVNTKPDKISDVF